jgi:hypothetical protein
MNPEIKRKKKEEEKKSFLVLTTHSPFDFEVLAI